MRIRFLLLGVVATVAGGAFALEACGDTEDTPATPSDSGVDSPADTGPADTGPADTGIDVAPSSDCDPNADFLDKIPDASIGDSGTTSGICVGCVEANCKTEVDKCNNNCVCQGLAADALDCYLKSHDVISCAGDFAGVQGPALNIGIALFTCVKDSCPTECATSQFEDAGTDAGAADGGDAGDGGN